MLTEASFDGEGFSPVMPFDVLVAHLRNVSAESLRRWLPVGQDLVHGVRPGMLRSTFAFQLPRDVATEGWTSFVRGEFRAGIEEAQKKAKGRFQIFSRIDGVEDRDIDKIVDASTIVGAPFGVLIAVILVARRPVLGLAAFCLAFAAPATACALLLSGGSAGGTDSERPRRYFSVVAVAAWLAVATDCTQMAIACSQRPHRAKASSRSAAEIGNCCMDNVGGRTKMWPFRRFSWFSIPKWFEGIAHRWLHTCLLEGVHPHAAVVVGLCVTALAINAEASLAAEFARHAGFGELVALFFAPVLFPAAAELDDAMKKQFWLYNSVKEENEESTLIPRSVLAILSPLFGPDATWHRHLRDATTKCAALLGSNILRSLFVLLMFFLFFVVWQLWPTFDNGMPPPLFRSGHYLRDGQEVMRRFDELSEALQIIDTLPESGIFCSVFAADAKNCTWRTCEASVSWQNDLGTCRCYSQKSSEERRNSTSGDCGIAARFWSDEALPAGFIQQSFWPRLVASANRVPTSEALEVVAPRLGLILEMENWETGDNTYQSEVSSFVGPSGSAPAAWEDACSQVLCFCGGSRCDLGSGWSEVISVAYADDQATEGAAVDGIDVGSSNPDGSNDSITSAGDTTMLTLATGAAVSSASIPSDETESVYVVWGLKRSVAAPNIPFDAAVQAPPDFLPDFQVEDPWVQRSLLAMCAGTAPDLGVVDQKCWITHFRQWLLDRGERFPVEAARFHTSLQKFVDEVGDTNASGGYRHFWLGEDGRILGTYAVFSVVKPAQGKGPELISRWEHYVGVRNRLAREQSEKIGEAWIVSPLVAEVEALSAFNASYSITVFLVTSVLFTILWAFCISWSVRMAFAVLLVFFLAVLFFLAFVGGPSRERSFGVLEFAALTAFIGSLVPPLLRVVQQYVLALGSPWFPLQAFDRDAQARYAYAFDDEVCESEHGVAGPAESLTTFRSMEGPNAMLHTTTKFGFAAPESKRRLADSSVSFQDSFPQPALGRRAGSSKRIQGMLDELKQVSFAAGTERNYSRTELTGSRCSTPNGLSHLTAQAGASLEPREGKLAPRTAQAERHLRVTAALLRSGEAVLGSAVAAGFGSLFLLSGTDATALGNIALGTFAGAAAAVPLAFGVLPMLLSSCLGPTKAYATQDYRMSPDDDACRAHSEEEEGAKQERRKADHIYTASHPSDDCVRFRGASIGGGCDGRSDIQSRSACGSKGSGDFGGGARSLLEDAQKACRGENKSCLTTAPSLVGDTFCGRQGGRDDFHDSGSMPRYNRGGAAQSDRRTDDSTFRSQTGRGGDVYCGFRGSCSENRSRGGFGDVHSGRREGDGHGRDGRHSSEQHRGVAFICDGRAIGGPEAVHAL
eukprot:TRINITY_DN26078_c0_g2_i1.p1 TRINITY_DN26078_c0_g2~~TRINITY_DN26078_c0_g2_i1.p1  ORF type:complete len:1510 (+),score=300.16 TRINITY_DN26078_c0_g2_i1:433-4530(+)